MSRPKLYVLGYTDKCDQKLLITNTGCFHQPGSRKADKIENDENNNDVEAAKEGGTDNDEENSNPSA